MKLIFSFLEYVLLIYRKSGDLIKEEILVKMKKYRNIFKKNLFVFQEYFWFIFSSSRWNVVSSWYDSANLSTFV